MSETSSLAASVSLERHSSIPAYKLAKRTPVDPSTRILEPSGHSLTPVKEATIYPAQFPILLRERLKGKSVAEVAEYLGVPPGQVNRLLAGHWRPTKGICAKMGLTVVYALAEAPKAAIS
jgi:hypothetical protein